MTMIRAAIIGVTFALLTLLLAPLAPVANAHGRGFSGHAFHFPRHFNSARHNRYFDQGLMYGGYGALLPYDTGNGVTYAAPETVVYVLEQPRELTCQFSRQTVTVPSEEGGTREITITRC
jgi:hypothetical protein